MKRRLFTPGPTPVPETVLLKMAEPIIHHRNPEFGEVMKRVNKNLRYVFQTEQPVVTLTCSGTGGFESTFVSLFSPGDTIISVNGGKFGERWVTIPQVFGLNVVEIKVPWGTAVQPGQVLDALKRNPDAKAVYLVHSETSTGTATDIKEMAKLIRANSNALVCVDGITAVGAHEMRFDAWGIDVCVTGSQKGLMIPPGLAFVALSQRAIDVMQTSRLPKFYLDLCKALKSYEKDDTPWTPAISLIVGLDAALEMIRAEGIENAWKRHERLALALRAGVTAVGLKLFSNSPSFAVTPVWLPDGVDWKSFNKTLKLDNGITIAGGQGKYAGRIFRVSHLGYYDDLDMVTVMAALERTLAVQNHKFTLGAGITAVKGSCWEEGSPRLGISQEPALVILGNKPSLVFAKEGLVLLRHKVNIAGVSLGWTGTGFIAPTNMNTHSDGPLREGPTCWPQRVTDLRFAGVDSGSAHMHFVPSFFCPALDKENKPVYIHPHLTA